MTKPKRRQTYPKDDSDKLRDANKKLRSEVRNLKKQLKIDTPISHFQNNNSLKYHNNQPQNEIL